jgi:hypothetical protein
MDNDNVTTIDVVQDGKTVSKSRTAEYRHEYYVKNKDKINQRHRDWYKRLTDEQKKALLEKKRNYQSYKDYIERKKSLYRTAEYREKRRAAYAEKHKDDPMTEHRRKCIEARERNKRLSALEAAIKDIGEENVLFEYKLK